MASEHELPSKRAMLALALAGSAIILLLGANAHLVYVAVATQPDCVPHAKDVGDNAKFRAAAPAC